MQAIREGRDDLREFAEHAIEGDADLRGVTYPHRFVLHDVTFEGHVDLFEAEFGRSVDFTGCVFSHGLNLAMTEIDGQLILSRYVVMARALPIRPRTSSTVRTSVPVPFLPIRSKCGPREAGGSRRLKFKVLPT